MSTPFPSFTKTWHNTAYPAISPTRAELSTKGRNAIVTGGGTGIGAATARAFAAAGSTQLAILGRRAGRLEETAREIEAEYPGTTVLTHTADVSKAETVQGAFDDIVKAFGKIDVCISNAGYLSKAEPLAISDLDDWWMSYETNVKGAYNIARAFLKVAKPGSALIDMTTAVAHLPALIPGHSAYASSKLASAKMYEYIAVENPEIHVVSQHPGLLTTEMSQKSGYPGFDDGK